MIRWLKFAPTLFLPCGDVLDILGRFAKIALTHNATAEAGKRYHFEFVICASRQNVFIFQQRASGLIGRIRARAFDDACNMHVPS
jgi:hypothetical protein